MAETSIEWTDFTVNFWWGCTEISPGCDHCYARVWDKRMGGDHWGVHADRRWIEGAPFAFRKIHKNAKKYRDQHGRWPNVFLHSMSDLFDNAVPTEWQTEALNCIAEAYNTRPQLLTKRVGNVEAAIKRAGILWPRHAGLMISVVNQAEADRDIPKLLNLKARLGIPWVGLSCEPLLSSVDLTNITSTQPGTYFVNALTGEHDDMGRPCAPVAHLDWVICGGESGPGARPMHPNWARGLRDQCHAAGVPFFFKQWGEWVPAIGLAVTHRWHEQSLDSFAGGTVDGPGMARVGKKAAGRLLDGREWNEVPHAWSV